MSLQPPTPVPDDYEPPKNYKEWPDGTYQAKTIEFTSLDDNGQPILKQQKNGRVARFNFMILQDGELKKGPNHGLFLHEFPMLAQAFGFSLSDVPPNDINAIVVTQFLQSVKQQLDANPNTIDINVKDKWVSSIPAMSVKSAFYNFRIVDVVSKNDSGQKSWYIKTWDDSRFSVFVKLLVEILAGNQGAKTPYAGVRITVDMPYGFKINLPGAVEWETTEGGEINIDAKRASNIYMLTTDGSIFAPPFSPPDPTNLVPYWLEVMQPPSPVLFGKIEANTSSKGYTFYKIKYEDVERSILTAEQLGFSTQRTQQPAPQPGQTPAPMNHPVEQSVATDDELDEKARNAMLTLLAGIAGGAVTENDINANIVLTQLGKTVAQTHLNPLREAGLVEGVLLTKASFDDSLKIAKALTQAATLNDDQKKQASVTAEQIELMLVRMNQPSQPEPTQTENPWA